MKATGDLTTEEFRERIRQICGAPPKQDKPLVRQPGDYGYNPPPRKNKTKCQS